MTSPPTRLSAVDRKLLFSLLSQLVSADTVNPPGHESRVAEVAQPFLRKYKIKFETYEKRKGRTNLLFSLGQGHPEIFVPAHADTVPVGDGWRTDPFRLIKKGGRIIGRGVVDNKGPLAGLLIAAKILKKLEPCLRGRIVFGALADEEAGNKFGIDYLLARKLIRPDYAIVPDSCGHNREIAIAEKGVLHLRITAFGRQGHGSLPESGLNAFYALSDFLERVRKLKFPKHDQLLGGTTLNIGVVQAGTVANLIPGEAIALLDLRFPFAKSRQAILKKIKSLTVLSARQWHARPFQIETLTSFPPSATPIDHPLVKTVVETSQTVTGKLVRIIGLPAFTLAGALRSQGIPTVSCGPGELSECHRANESLPVTELVEFTEVMIETLKQLTIFNLSACLPKN